MFCSNVRPFTDGNKYFSLFDKKEEFQSNFGLDEDISSVCAL